MPSDWQGMLSYTIYSFSSRKPFADVENACERFVAKMLHFSELHLKRCISRSMIYDIYAVYAADGWCG